MSIRPRLPTPPRFDPRTPRRRLRLSLRRQEGQSMVEFALVLTPLMLILLGVMQMGFVLNAYVTMSNAAREGGRAATTHVYERTLTKSQNDANRETVTRTAVTNAMGSLSRSSPQFSSSDLQLSYALPSGTVESDARAGQRVTVRATYHLDLIIPFIANFLPRDSTGRLPIGTEVTMVIG